MGLVAAGSIFDRVWGVDRVPVVVGWCGREKQVLAI
jgi:hypothetical protein